VPTCFWRSVGPGHNIFVVESFVDELAHAAGQDPAAFRRAHLAKEPRLLACLNLAAEKAGGGSALPARVGRGVACQSVVGSYVAAIVEAEVDSEGEIAIRRVMAVVDCGTVVNPDSVEAQIQGGLIFGLTAAFYNEIIIAKRSEIGPKTRSRITSLRDTPSGEAQQQGRWAKRSISARASDERRYRRHGRISAPVPPIANPNAPAPKPPDAIAGHAPGASGHPRGEQIDAEAGASCHGWTGKSPIWGLATIAGARSVNDPSGVSVAQVILFGGGRKPGEAGMAMPAFGDAYSDAEIAAAANYVTARFGAAGSRLTAENVASLRLTR
jgi:mono/diheme cytochrome c family protein